MKQKANQIDHDKLRAAVRKLRNEYVFYKAPASAGNMANPTSSKDRTYDHAS